MNTVCEFPYNQQTSRGNRIEPGCTVPEYPWKLEYTHSDIKVEHLVVEIDGLFMNRLQFNHQLILSTTRCIVMF